MAEIAILDPRVLPRVVQEYEAGEEFYGLTSIVDDESDTQPFWEYDIEVHSRGAMQRYNSHNSEAVLLDQLPVGHMQGAYAYQRVKKKFSPTTLRFLRRVGEGLASAAAGEEKVVRETEDIRLQIRRAEEDAVWKMLQGTWSFKTETNITYNIDYKIPSDHKVDVGTGWGLSGDDPIGDISAIKRVVQRNSGFPIRRAIMNNVTITKFYELPEVSGGITNSVDKQGQLSDMQKQSFQNERVIPRFHGIDWVEYDAGYLAGDNPTLAEGIYTPYIPDNMIILLTDGGTNPFKFKYGPAVDHDAPNDWTGVFTKSWIEPDPSVRQVLMELQYMPMLTNPYKLATMDVS